ncbi:P-loop containing nucleoside triphosphate hydrolase protein [Gongronella butleri]|nr:P-loop containing nucleoside triphosphate hydrolase protein [Gongronella butleri]
MLEVIGAGFGRTGTHSLYLALNKLGSYKTHHMVELLGDPTQDPSVWSHAYDRPNSPDTDWERVYGNYTAAVDFPTCTFYKELSEVYPDTKIILTVRSAESWYKSMSNTIFKNIKARKAAMKKGAVFEGHAGEVMKMMGKTAMGGTFFGDPAKLDDAEAVMKIFNDHIEEVKRTIPAERLLVLELGSGWEPLCNFLGKPIPDEEYPRSNSSDEFHTVSRNALEKGTPNSSTVMLHSENH